MKRRTLWDALHDKLIELIDAYDIAGVLDAPKKPVTVTVRELGPEGDTKGPQKPQEQRGVEDEAK